MEQYFFKITATYTSKNKLYEEFSQYIHSLDGTLLKDQKALDFLISEIKETAKELNEKHSRCKPIYVSETRYAGYGIVCHGSWAASVYKVERVLRDWEGTICFSNI